MNGEPLAEVAQVVAHYLLALKLGIARGTVSSEEAREHIRRLVRQGLDLVGREV